MRDKGMLGREVGWENDVGLFAVSLIIDERLEVRSSVVQIDQV